MVARTSGAVQGDRFLIVLPLSFGSNTFVPTDTMPGWLQAFVKVNPISHLVSTVRALMLGGPYADRPGLDAGLDGGAAGGLRAAGPAGLPPAGLSGATGSRQEVSRDRVDALPRVGPVQRARPSA